MNAFMWNEKYVWKSTRWCQLTVLICVCYIVTRYSLPFQDFWANPDCFYCCWTQTDKPQTIKLQLFFIFVYTICIEHSFECVGLFRTDHYRRYGSILHKLLNYYTYVCAELTNRPTEVPKLKLNSKNEPKVKHFIYIIFINSPKPTCTFHTVTNGLKASERFIHLWCCVHVFWLV